MSSNHHSTPQDRSRRRRATIIAAVVVALVVAWVAVIAALAGQSPPGGGERGLGSGEPQQQSDPGGSRGSTEQGSGAASGRDSPADDASDGPSEEELEEVADEALSEPPGGGPPAGEVPIEDREGRSGGQRGFVSSFVGAAYGYTGEEVDEYRAGYEPRIETDTYYDSAGGKVLEEYAAMVEDGRAENTAVLKDYRITSGEPVQTEVNAARIEQFAPPQVMEEEIPEGATLSEVTYAVGDRYGDPSKDENFGAVYGDVDYLKQRFFLSREQGGWRIVAASAPDRTQAPERLDPDAPKVGYEPPGGHDHGGHGHEHGAS